MVRIIVADDHGVVRQGVKSLLHTDPDFRVVAEADDGPEVLMLLEAQQPDVLVMDLAMPSIDGWTVTQKAHERWPDLRIIILSIHADEASVRRALANGAMGYILKDAPTEDLLQAVKTVMVGRRYLSPLLSERAIDVFVNGTSSSSSATADTFETLTSREREVFDLAAEGLNNNEIAVQLSISPRTAETHRANIMRKLGLRTQTELVRYAIRRGGMEQ